MVRILAAVVWLSASCVALGQIVPPVVKNNYTCSMTTPCALGCCSNQGFCGFGPAFCGLGNCTSNCDRKSECDAGWGSQWSNTTDCPLNVCCSKYGFCGTTPEFCGDAVVASPSCSKTSATSKKRVIGYYEAWSQQRNCDQMFPADIPQGAWTHLNFAFAYVDPKNFSIVPMDPRDVNLYRDFTNLKKANPGLETWISVGGWSMNDPGETQTAFSGLAASLTAQAAFSASLIKFMDTWGFDGVDIDWEYPVAEERAGRPEDFTNFVTWMRNLRADLDDRYGLTITIPSSYWYMRHFDIVSLIKYVDWFNVMTYDLHGIWDAVNPYVGPFVNSHTNLTEIDQTMDLLWRNDIPAEKVVMGLGFYGRSFTLADPNCDIEGCYFASGGAPGLCTANTGTLSFAEIESIVHSPNSTAKVHLEPHAAVQEVVFSSSSSSFSNQSQGQQQQWVSYDDLTTFGLKYSYANSKCLGGLMIWAVSHDDHNGTAQKALCSVLGCTVRTRTEAGIGPIACGSNNPQCTHYHQVIQDDTCYGVSQGAGLSLQEFHNINPSLKSDCSNLELGVRYCVASNGMSNAVADCSSPTAISTSTKTNMLANPPLSIQSGCQLHSAIIESGSNGRVVTREL